MVRRNCSLLLCTTLLLALPVRAQSDAASQASAASLEALSEIPPAALALVVEGARFSVTALHPVGDAIHVVLTASASGASFALEVSAATVEALGLAVGTIVTTTAVAAGHLLRVGAEVIAFVPSAAAEALLHRRELSR